MKGVKRDTFLATVDFPVPADGMGGVIVKMTEYLDHAVGKGKWEYRGREPGRPFARFYFKGTMDANAFRRKFMPPSE